MAHEFDSVPPHHYGERSDNWNALYYPLGDARASLGAVAAILRGESSAWAEKREPALLP